MGFFWVPATGTHLPSAPSSLTIDLRLSLDKPTAPRFSSKFAIRSCTSPHPLSGNIKVTRLAPWHLVLLPPSRLLWLTIAHHKSSTFSIAGVYIQWGQIGDILVTLLPILIQSEYNAPSQWLRRKQRSALRFHRITTVGPTPDNSIQNPVGYSANSGGRLVVLLPIQGPFQDNAQPQ